MYIYIHVYIFTYAHTQTRRFMRSSVSGAVFQMTSGASGAVYAAVGCVLAVAKVLVLPYAAVLVLLYSAQRSIMFQSPSVRLTPLSVLKALPCSGPACICAMRRTCVLCAVASVCWCVCALSGCKGGASCKCSSLSQQVGCNKMVAASLLSGSLCLGLMGPTHDTTGRW